MLLIDSEMHYFYYYSEIIDYLYQFWDSNPDYTCQADILPQRYFQPWFSLLYNYLLKRVYNTGKK